MSVLNSFTGASSRALGFSNADPPAAPTFSTTKTATTITVTYTLNSGAFPIQTTQYKVGSGSYVTVTGGSFVISNLSVNTPYTITMVSTDIAGQTSLESSSTVTTDPETLPSAPASVTASSSSSTTLSINFTAATAGTYPIARYEYVLNNPAGTWTTTPTGPGATFIQSGLTADATYTVYVRAVASTTNNVSATNASVTAQVNPGTPASPSLSFASTGSSERSNAYLSWDSPSYATLYHVYRNGVYYAATTSTSMTVAVSAGADWNFRVYAGNRIGNFSGSSNIKYMTTGQTNVPYVKRNNSIRYVADPTFTYGGDTYNNDVVSTITLPTISTNDPNTAGYIYINSMGATFAWMQAPGISGNPDYATVKTSINYSFVGTNRSTQWKTDATISGNGWTYGYNNSSINSTTAINKYLGDNYYCYVSTGGTAISGARFSVAAVGSGWSSLSSAPDPNDSSQSYGTLIGYNYGSGPTNYAYALIMSSLYVEGTQTTPTIYA